MTEKQWKKNDETEILIEDREKMERVLAMPMAIPFL